MGAQACMTYNSPLRYPGGKAGFANFLSKTLEMNHLSGCDYLEPFAGGAGAALRLLREGIVSKLYLNDFDRCIYAFWWAILNETERFVDELLSIPINVKEWKKQSNIFYTKVIDQFQLGFATFYLNRCNRSGILRGSGPIGGFSQKGKWKIDARFNREGLVDRIRSIARYRGQIEIRNLNAVEFLIEHWRPNSLSHKIFAYLDPPYYINGNRLYFNGLKQPEDHAELAAYVQNNLVRSWIISYDNGEHISRFFQEKHCEICTISPQYSLQTKKPGKEVLIIPRHLQIPDTALVGRHCHGYIPDGESA